MSTRDSFVRGLMVLFAASLAAAFACSGGNADGSDPGVGAAGADGPLASSGEAGQTSDGAGGRSGGSGFASGGEAGAENGGSPGPDGVGGAASRAAVSGIVSAFRPNPANIEERIAGALVTLDDGSQQFSTLSDRDGAFSFDVLPPGHYRASVTVSAPAAWIHDGAPYGDWYGEVGVVAEQNTSLMPLLNLGCTVNTGVDTGSEVFFDGTFSHSCAAYGLFGRLRVPPDGLAREDGTAFTGMARLELSPIWYPVVGAQPNMKGLAGMPPLVGVPEGEAESEPIHTFAAADVRLYDAASGERLGLKDGAVAELTLRGWRELTEDDVYTSWSFEPATGLWREEGACTRDEAEPQLVHCEVRHFSWWNADGRSSDGGSGTGSVVISPSCVTGGVLHDGQPLIGADVISTGASGIVGMGQAKTDENGAFCAESISNGGDWDVQVRVANGREILTASLSVPRGKLPASCDEPVLCAQAGVIELQSSPALTVRGKLGLDVKGEQEPMPQGGFSFGTVVRAIGSTDAFGYVQLNLGEVQLGSDGEYEFDIPEAVVRLFFASPEDGECKTYPGPVPGEGNPVEIADQFFICGS